jgi:glycosyltransferase involved in cell wall biosynthesis
MKVIHFITALESGGAEKILFDTICGSKVAYNHKVIVLSKKGIYCRKIEEIGIVVEKISIRLLWDFLFLARNNFLIHSYLSHSHIFSAVFKLMGYPVIWSMHSSYERKINLKTKLTSWLSFLVPSKIIYVSNFAQQQHARVGFTKKKSIVIYNGLDIDKFKKCNKCILNIDRNKINICMIARYHPVKNYPKFFAIARYAIRFNSNCHFYLIGKGNDKGNLELVALLNENNLNDNITLINEMDDMSSVIPCFDLLISTSKSESFGLTIVEAILFNINVSTINLPVMDELFEYCSPNTGELKDEDIAKIWLEKSKENPNDTLIQYANNYSLDRMIKSYKSIYKDYLK